MEVAVAQTQLTRSASLTATSARLRLYDTLRLRPSPRMHAASRRLYPLRHATTDADMARSAPAASSPLLRDILHGEEEVEGAGAGAGKGNDRSGRGRRGGDGGGQGMHMNMGEYYRRVLRMEPENPLVLRNYGRYLQEVEGDMAGAEDCYGRALLSCPDDGDLLTLYGRVLWEARQDKERAATYLERAVQAAPDDCYVLGSYASFLWDAEQEDDDDETPESASPLSLCT
ncbi:hypothetical protein GUJ93_ZPchr0010g7663 [Zizania palustris]|uniref:Uncharacterized protein n=1 Tax=Zizania palustris TaxID=103762 RepID=A0A8J5W7Y1_ZIZPA|nr:hypothetical protein GUJ93_ZPchr0010g7663 [Zizania palustris]